VISPSASKSAREANSVAGVGGVDFLLVLNGGRLAVRLLDLA
jgi:hypothetical protein